MIKKRSLTNGVNANVSLEPSAASQSTSNISNNIIINKRDDGKEDIVITRDIELEEPEEKNNDVRNVILETLKSFSIMISLIIKSHLQELYHRSCISSG